MRYHVVAQGLEYLRAAARVPTVYFALSRLVLAQISLKTQPVLKKLQARPIDIMTGRQLSPGVFLRNLRYHVVAQGLEYLRAAARVPTVYFALSRLVLAQISLKTQPVLKKLQARPIDIMTGRQLPPGVFLRNLRYNNAYQSF